MRLKKLFLFIFSLVALGIACSTFSGSNAVNNSNSVPSNQNTAPTPTTTQSTSDSSVSSEEDQQQELPPLSLVEILNQGIDAGTWTQGEGLVQIMKYIVGDISAEDIPDISEVVEQEGTGIVRISSEYIDSPDADPEIAAELEHLLRIVFPPQEVLDIISQPTSSISKDKLASTELMPPTQSSWGCEDLAQAGYDIDQLPNADEVEDDALTQFFSGECYTYKEQMVDNLNFRVYFPKTWDLVDERRARVDISMQALIESAARYKQFQNLTVKDIYLTFAIAPFGTTKGFTNYFDTENEACPIAMMPLSDDYPEDYFKQGIAHEVFHCVSMWTFPNVTPYEQHTWWMEGASEYFSNLVYPNANLEFRALGHFDSNSIEKSILQMSYDNFVFFQFMGNQYTAESLVDIIHDISAAGTLSSQQTVLSNVPDIETNFNLFVVEFLSTGVPDSGGGFITVEEAAKSGTKTISEKGEQEFSTEPFVATRYKVEYEKEKRFLQTGNETDGGSFSAAEYSWHKNLYSWSDLPPEVRSYCKEELPYYFVVTTTKSGNYEYKADVTLAEKAVCDPCLLGVWAVNNDSFEDYILRIMEDSGEMPDLNGSEIVLEIEGRNYLEFKVEGKLNTRRDAFTIATGLSNTDNWITTMIDSQGTGTYSADGEKLKVFGLTDYVNSITAQVGGVPISMSQTPGATTVNIFGQTADVPGASGAGVGDGPQQASGTYVCDEETLTVDQPDYGELLFDRVDEILPTPIPTPVLVPNP